MACLGSVLYDPASVSTHAASALLAMTAIDTTNARITFTAPANGTVMVRLRVAQKGATIHPQLLLGVLDGATVKGRQVPVIVQTANVSTNLTIWESIFLVTGLTPGNSFTWDAAYGVQTAAASALIGAGGPNDATASNAYGALSFDIWDTANLLAGVMYDPATAVSKAAGSAASAMAAFDTTNLRLTFTPPASGRVLVRLYHAGAGITTGAPSTIFLGVMSGASIIARQAAMSPRISAGTISATDKVVFQAQFVVAGLSGSQTWDAAFGVETPVSGQTLNYGGPNDALGADAFGGFAYEVWAA